VQNAFYDKLVIDWKYNIGYSAVRTDCEFVTDAVLQLWITYVAFMSTKNNSMYDDFLAFIAVNRRFPIITINQTVFLYTRRQIYWGASL